MMTQYQALIHAPFGVVAIAMQGNQLGIDLLLESPSQEQLQQYHPKEVINPIVKQAHEQIQQYLKQPTSTFFKITAPTTRHSLSATRLASHC